MRRPPAHPYESVGLDRAPELRRDAGRLAALAADPASRWLGLRDLLIPVVAHGDALRLALGPRPAEAGEPAVFLGLAGGTPVFAVPVAATPPGVRHRPLREVAPHLAATELGLGACARALIHWHATHRHCGRCGTLTRVEEGGHLRRCPACGLEVHPRTDPAVIVLVHDGGDRCLLGRAPRFPPGLYSTLAGFVEPGESPEAAVVREVREEVGIAVDPPRYVSAQPWPFPQSLMLGFFARARDRTLVVDRSELVDARWFTRAELADPLRRPVRLPRPDSIARYLIECWLAGAVPVAGSGSSSRASR